MEFAKLHGLGNDFLVVRTGELGRFQRSLSSLARILCDRHCGIGADGIMYYQPTAGDREADFSTLIFNADGSKAETSGNGVRCLAAFLHCSGRHSSSAVRIRTVSGIRVLTLQKQEGRTYWFECSMGVPITDPKRVPVQLGAGPDPVLGQPLSVNSETVSVTVSSMGNPHCSTFWPDVAVAPLESLGRALESHPCFPNRTNVEFIQVVSGNRLRVRFWERGAGHTLASGTGSCAAAVAAILHRLVVSPVTVETELGALVVRWEAAGEVFLTGPAQFICSGTFPDEIGDAQWS